MEWDFARYIIGTNSSTESHEWLSVPIDEPTWQSSDELAASLRESLALDLREVFDYLWSGTRTVWRETPHVGSGTEAESPAAGDSSMSYPVREPHIDTLLEEPFARLLSEKQSAAYEATKEARGQKEPRLRLDAIQRYIWASTGPAKERTT